MSLDECLPADLRGPNTAITPIAAGLSGAGVYRVETGDQTFVLKVARPSVALDEWQRRCRVQQTAASQHLAPAVVHVDAARRAVLSAYVADRSFARFYGDPRTRDEAIHLLGRTLAAVHGLPIAPDMDARDPRVFVADTWSALAGVAMPAFVADAVAALLAEEPPPPPYLVLSHNDVNPTNLVHDGSTLQLLDWDMAGPNDPYYDLAAAAVFFRMDDAACRALFEAYAALDPDGPRFGYCRRLVAILCGTTFLCLAHLGGHVGDASATLASTAGLGDFYQRLQAGSVDIRSADGQWAFGVALIKATVA